MCHELESFHRDDFKECWYISASMRYVPPTMTNRVFSRSRHAVGRWPIGCCRDTWTKSAATSRSPWKCGAVVAGSTAERKNGSNVCDGRWRKLSRTKGRRGLVDEGWKSSRLKDRLTMTARFSGSCKRHTSDKTAAGCTSSGGSYDKQWAVYYAVRRLCRAVGAVG